MIKNKNGPSPEEIVPEILEDAQAPGEDILEDTAAEGESASLIALLEDRNNELTSALASARADFFNYRKRVERDRQRERVLAGEEKALDFLPVLDNLDRALAVDGEADGKSILQGVTMVRRQFLSVLESMGVEQIATVGTAFSPSWHEAVAAEPTDDPEKNGVITEEILSGFRSGDRVLRPAKVKVASYSENRPE